MGIGVWLSGTRTTQTSALEHPPSRKFDRSMQQDLGLLGLVSASMTFVASPTSQVQAANGTFTNKFQVGQNVLFEGSVLNGGIFRILAIDAVNGAFLTLDNPPQNEGPITVTARVV